MRQRALGLGFFTKITPFGSQKVFPLKPEKSLIVDQINQQKKKISFARGANGIIYYSHDRDVPCIYLKVVYDMVREGPTQNGFLCTLNSI